MWFLVQYPPKFNFFSNRQRFDVNTLSTNFWCLCRSNVCMFMICTYANNEKRGLKIYGVEKVWDSCQLIFFILLVTLSVSNDKKSHTRECYIYHARPLTITLKSLALLPFIREALVLNLVPWLLDYNSKNSCLTAHWTDRYGSSICVRNWDAVIHVVKSRGHYCYDDNQLYIDTDIVYNCSK